MLFGSGTEPLVLQNINHGFFATLAKVATALRLVRVVGAGCYAGCADVGSVMCGVVHSSAVRCRTSTRDLLTTSCCVALISACTPTPPLRFHSHVVALANRKRQGVTRPPTRPAFVCKKPTMCWSVFFLLLRWPCFGSLWRLAKFRSPCTPSLFLLSPGVALL